MEPYLVEVRENGSIYKFQKTTKHKESPNKKLENFFFFAKNLIKCLLENMACYFFFFLI